MDELNGKSLITLTAEDEDPNCNECNHACDSDAVCKNCGPEHAWARYERTFLEEMEEKDNEV